MNRRWFGIVLLSLGAATGALAREPGFAEFRAVQESLRSVHPRFVPRWLETHGYDTDEFMPRPWSKPDSTGLVLRGKWGRGRSVEVTGQDSLVFLSLGSEIAILNFANPADPQLLTELQLGFCPTQTYVRDSLLVTGGYSCIETWNISDIMHPVFRGRVQYRVGDFCVRDSFLHFVSYDDDSFRVWSIADPAVPRQLGACRDSGWATTVSGNTVVLVLRDGYGFMDVSNPQAPARVGFYGGNSIAAKARGTICCVSNDEGGSPATASFEVLDISNPAAPYRLSKLTASGGYDIELTDTLAFVSGWQQPYGEFCVIGISDSTDPHKLGTYTTPGDNWGVWAILALHRAFIADWRRGLCLLDIASLVNPILETTLLVADQAEDIHVRGGLAFVADYGGGLKILDVSDPATPVELGGLDSADAICWSVVAADSFAFVGWLPGPYFRAVSVSDPAYPTFAGSCSPFEFARDMAMRDSFVYCAEAYRFQVVNVARPRQPVLVGSCVLSSYATDLHLVDTLAFLSGLPLTIVNVAQPDSPRIVSTWSRGVSGLDVVDTMLYAVGQNAQFWALSISDPAAPRPLDSLHLPGWDGQDVAVVGSTAFVGERTIRIVDVSDPSNLRLTGAVSVPGWANRLLYEPPYLYAACFDAGVCVFETTTTGIHEPESAVKRPAAIRAASSLVRDRLTVEIPSHKGEEVMWSLYSVAGARVPVAATLAKGNGGSTLMIDLRAAPAGAYILRVRVGGLISPLRFIKL